jgi:hypothetical protein
LGEALWVNDEDNKRTYEGGDDAYRIFRKMVESGHAYSAIIRVVQIGALRDGKCVPNLA